MQLIATNNVTPQTRMPAYSLSH